ncbi:hypothetical protein IU501_34550 [Nocardia otitidiscaviarum]|uniref:hypothetical protein n=1 Tax=Nocardia otitidiscaviarum TaxID=1823 RepID=UPI001895BBA2|nr:hypothetical protein [Nocardia otitidiscaviarum]MBF6138091.1 hypothetical protein [Nocardia otitidiscaviarum]
MRADINEVFRQARAASLPACGVTIRSTPGEGMTDEQGHPIAIVHSGPAYLAVARIQAVNALHHPDPEGFVPICRECGKPSPCPTLEAIRAVEQQEVNSRD